MVDGVGAQSVGLVEGEEQPPVAVELHQSLAECAHPEVAVTVVPDVVHHAVGQLAVDVLACLQLSVAADVDTVVGCYPQRAVRGFLEGMHVKVPFGRLDACEAACVRVALQDAVFVESQPQCAVTVLVDGVDVCVRAGIPRQGDDVFRVCPVIDHQFVFPAGPQTRAVVEGDAPHLPITEYLALVDARCEYVEQWAFVAQEVHSLPVVPNPDVAERVLKEAACVGRGDAFALSGADVVEVHKLGGGLVDVGIFLRVEHAHPAHLRADPQPPVVRLADVVHIVGDE